MNKIPISEVMRRERSLAMGKFCSPRVQLNASAMYESLQTRYNRENAFLLVENWRTLSDNTDIAFTQVMEVFDLVSENGTKTDIEQMTRCIKEEVMPKVRDASQMQTYLKQKLGRLKTKLTTKINGKVDAVKVAARQVLPTDKRSLATTTNIKECYENMLEVAETFVHCDRVISNDIKLCKRFNINEYVIRNITTPDTIRDCILELCSFVDTYEMPLKVKCNVALENVMYTFAKLGIVYEHKNLVNDVTDYFLMNQEPIVETSLTTKERKELKDSQFGLPDLRAYPIHDKAHVIAAIRFFNKCPKGKEKELAKNIKRQANKFGVEIHAGSKIDNALNETASVQVLKRVLENNKFLDNEDLKDVDYLISIEDLDNYDSLVYNVDDGAIDEAMITLAVQEATTNKVKELINAYKIQPVKTPESLKALVNKLYTCDKENIVEEYPNLLQWIFQFFVVAGALAISPILAVIVGMTNYMISMHLQRKQCKKILDSYYKQKERAEKRLEKAESEDQKDRIKKYIEQMDKEIKKIEDYYEDLLDDKEKDEFYDSKPKGKDDDFNFDFDFNESAKDMYELGKQLLVIESQISSILEYTDEDLIDIVSADIDDIPMDDIDTMTDIAMDYPDILNPHELQEAFSTHRMNLKRNANGNIKSYIRIDCMNENISKLKNYKNVLKEDVDLVDMKIKYIAVKESLTTLNEMNFTNTIKLTIERLKKGASNLSAQEQIASRTLDASLEQMKGKIEKALTQENREAVIKGDILPPASKIIKLGITSGIAALISPVLSVIVLLGTFAVNTRLRAKERQMVLDELDVELQMVEKYIKIAEEKNDMKNLRDLLMIQKKLQAQEARLRYKMNIQYKQDTTPTTKDRD